MFVKIVSESDLVLKRYGVDTNSETPRSAHSHIVVDKFVIRPGVEEIWHRHKF